ncbi:MAG TPA: MASE1 domain-containing protein, partial [Solirubrobacteraceae bacterium]
MLAVTVAYYGAAKLGLGLTFAHAGESAIWPAAGVALAAVLLGGYELLPAVALGAFLASVSTALPLGSVLGITAGNTLEALVGAALLRGIGFRGSLHRLRDVVALVALAGFASTAVGATAGVASMLAGGAVAHSAIGLAWREWWLGGMGGILVCTPVLLVLAAAWPLRWPRQHRLEALAAGAVLVLASVVVLRHGGPLAYLAVPALFWTS